MKVFGKGRTEDDLARTFGITRQGVNNRKPLLTEGLRRLFRGVD